jgi:hypothetical protein
VPTGSACDRWQAASMTEPDPWEAAQTYTWEQNMRRGGWPTPPHCEDARAAMAEPWQPDAGRAAP